MTSAARPLRYITEYKATWPESFGKISGAIRKELPEACRVHHVGSTAVPGMPSKDVVDVDIECPAGSMASVIEALARLGYEHQGDRGIRGREAFRPLVSTTAGGLPGHHLYACEESALEFHKHVALRDYLLAHRDRMEWLADQKRLADQAAGSRDEYIQNKALAYARITAEAMEWASGAETRSM